MAITDNRTSITTNDTTANIDNIAGAAGGTQNTETFIEGTASTSVKISQTVAGLLYDAASAQDWSDQHFYIWWNCTTGGKLNTKALGGVRMRFCGATVTDFFEVYLEGKDTYSGGFKMTVIDIEKASASPDNTGGTAPATTAIRYVGIVWDVTAMISGNVDNCFLDAMWRLPAATPGILVEAQNSGAVDWIWQDIVDAADTFDTTKAWGTVFKRDGVVFINTPIRFGANDAVTHGFSDENIIIGWEDQVVADIFYGLDVIGGSGTQSFELGLKSGTGDDAIGTQGCTILADAAGARWFFDADDANIDVCNLYGCSFIHGDDFQIDDAAIETISCQFLDCSTARVDNSLFLRNLIINANTADGYAFLTTDDFTDVRFSTFVFSDGHAIELTTPRVATQTNKGNTFTDYGADDTNDAALYNNTAGAVTIDATEGATIITRRNGTSASTTQNVSVSLEINGLTEGSYGVLIGDGGGEDGVELLAGYADSTGKITGTFGGTTPQAVLVKTRNSGLISAAIEEDNGTGFTDHTNDARDKTGTNDVDLLPASPALNDAFYYGGIQIFEKLKIDVTVVGDTYVLTWEYWNGAWVALAVTDDTNSYTATGWGTVSFTAPGDWATTTVNSQGPFYYIRARATTGGGTQPQGEEISLYNTVKYLPFNSTGTVASGTGLTTTAVWLVDTNADFER